MNEVLSFKICHEYLILSFVEKIDLPFSTHLQSDRSQIFSSSFINYSAHSITTSVKDIIISLFECLCCICWSTKENVITFLEYDGKFEEFEEMRNPK